MNYLRLLLNSLASIDNPFTLPTAYLVPHKGWQAVDMSVLSRDFRTVITGLTKNASLERTRLGVTSN